MSASSRLSRFAGLPLGCLALTLLMLAFSGAVAVAPAGAVTFASHADSATGSQPFAIAVGDFNGDGKLDLAAANYGANTVSILLGNGNGTFAAKTDYATGDVPQSVAVGDFTGDGKLDLAVANGYANTVSILLGNGNGTFAAKTDYATGTLPQSVAVGDFNGDGKLDLVTANSSSSVNTVSILLGNGNGTFAAKTDYATGAVPLSVAVGDVNGDGKLDLAVANNNGTSVSILLGNGNGTFAAKTDYAAASWPQQVVVADFNLDGKQDLGVVASPANTVRIYLGDGSGTFGAKVDYATGSQPGSVAVGDVNGDGRPDMATANWNADTVSVLLGNGNGSFAAKTDFATGAGPASVAVGDFNADGKLDVATANISANTVSVLLNIGSPPAGSVSLDGGATWSNSRSMTIDSAVTGATQMRFRDQGGAWSAWETYAATKSWTVPDGDGSKTVQAQYCNADATLTCSDSIGLDTTPPDITVPVWESDMTLEAVSPAGNVVNFHVTITDAVDPAPALTITPASGSTFPLGATTVTLTGTDAAGNTATKTLMVTIKDTIAPHLTPTDNITAEATSAGGAVLDFTATATDTGDAHPAVTSVPASGSVFHLGTTLVTVTATDASGNIATGTFSVWVRDTTGPTLAKPDDITAEATGPGGAHVSWADIVATDAVDGNITAVCTPASGSLFALGETTVNVVAMDAHGNSSATTFKVTVEAPPSLLTVPGDYATIQAAVAAAAPGDTVAVAAGTYHEHLNIAKPLTLTGAGAGATVIDGSGSGPVLTVSGAGVTVRQLTVTNGGSSTHPASNGIRVVNASAATFDGVESSFNEAAYMVVSSSGTTVRGGSMHDNHAFAFDNGDTYSADTLIVDCDVYDNLGTQGGGAINAYAGSTGFTVRRTHVHDNVNAGVQIGWSSGWLVEDSTLARNAHGLILDTASSGTCRRCELSDNTGYGVSLGGWGPSGNLFTANSIRRNDQGCRLSGPNASGNTFRDNTLGANAVGIAITLNASGDNTGNRIYRNNFAANTLQATDQSAGGNYWDNGLPDGGNWWSDWTAPDADHDGFVDAAYVFTTGRDNHPFAERLPALTVPGDYATIQAAVAAAAPGDTVAVAAGTYHEHLNIAKPLTLTGAGAGATVIDGSGSGPVLTVSGAGVTVRQLTVTNGGSSTHPASNGIRVVNASAATFDGVESSFNEAAYMVVSSSGTTVRGGSMHDNHAFAFDNGDTYSADTLIVDCDVYDNLGTQGGGAINAYAGSTGFTVRRTHVHDNVNAGVQIGWSSGWLVEDSTLARNAHGLILDTASSGTCRRCELSDNTGYGVSLGGWGPSGNLFTANSIRRNDQGCRLSGPNASGNTFRDNTLGANAVGIAITLNASGDNTGNRIYRNNFAANTLQATDQSAGGNYWDNGLPDGGNWWSDWTAPDADHDGFVDAAYVFTTGRDNHPFVDEVLPRTLTVTAPNGGEDWAAASVQALHWQLNAPVSSGEFYAWVIDGAGNWYDAAQAVPAVPGETDYTHNWTVNAPVGAGYRLAVYYRATVGAGLWLASDLSDQPFAISGTALTIAAPNGGEDWGAGSVQSLHWQLNAPVASGEFYAWVIAANGTWYDAAQAVPAVAGETDYFHDWTVSAPVGSGYRLAVYYRATTGAGLWLASDLSDQPFAISGTALTIAAPNGGEDWGAGSVQSLHWQLNAPVSSGEFYAWVIDGAGNWYDAAQAVPAVPGETDYTHNWTVNAPVGAGYRLAVYYRATVGAGLWLASDLSDQPFAISGTALTIAAPNGGEDWGAGSVQSLHWQLNAPVASGEFYAWVIAANGTWYDAAQAVPAVAGETDYFHDWTVSAPVGSGYRLAVYYRATTGAGLWLASDLSDQPFAISGTALTIAAPNGGEDWGAGSVQSLHWQLNAPVASGEFYAWVIAANGTWYDAAQAVPAVAGETDYFHDWTVSAPVGSGYRLAVYYRATTGAGLWLASDLSDQPFAVGP